MVRFANPNDIPRIVALARIEHGLSPWADIPFDEGAAAETARRFIATMGHTLIVAPGGYIAGQIQPMGFSRRLMALEYAWFSADGTGMGLLEKFEEWARDMGCVQVIVHDHVSRGRLERALYRRRDYQPLGRAMARELEH